MPLAFHSLNHDTVAFGYFNIESDMLLLERYFFFATQCCRHIKALALDPAGTEIEQTWEIFDIPDRAAVGDLMGAIHGIRFTGFIGEVYRRFPFPSAPEDFKQNPKGDQTRETIAAIIQTYGQSREITVRLDASRNRIALGEYDFDRNGFQALVRYVWQGGYPRWRDNCPPDYVHAMKSEVERNSSPLFNKMHWE
jgi:hypothetical protein